MEKEFITVEVVGLGDIHLNKSEIAYFYENPDFTTERAAEDEDKKELSAMSIMVLKSGYDLYLHDEFNDLKERLDYPLIDKNEFRFRIIESVDRTKCLVEYQNGIVRHLDMDYTTRFKSH